MRMKKLAFIPGDSPPLAYPLARYLPIIPDGMIRGLLSKHVKSGGLILDPFGSSPAAILEAARAGYRVIVASNNPIITHLLRIKAGAYSRERFVRILASLAATRKGDERLEKHVEELYKIECPDCSSTNQARMFIWAKGASSPSYAILDCHNCKRKSELPAVLESQQKLVMVVKAGMHRARAIERIAAGNDPIRPRVEQALESYLVRPLYILFTILNRLESLQLEDEDKTLIQALLISAFDAGNTLWPHPSSNLRPKQLIHPPHIKENNLWLVINDAISEWCEGGVSVPIVEYPQVPPASGGVSIFPGRFRELARQLGTKISIDGVLAILPRPNQAFWTLSAIWAGWLWGAAAVQPFRSALIRQRYDWQWYADAISSITSSLTEALLKDTAIVGLLSEYEPAFLNSTLAAFDSSGFNIIGYALNPEISIMQLIWDRKEGQSELGSDLRPAIRKAMIGQMVERNQPVEYPILGAAAGIALAENHLFRAQAGEPSDRYTTAQNSLKAELLTAGDYIRYRGQRTLETEIWWKQGIKVAQYSLEDQVEMAILEILIKNNGVELVQINTILNDQFPGLLTPSGEMIRTVLDSYGEISESPADAWRLMPRENPLSRQADVTEIMSTLKVIGEKFGYTAEGETDVTWKDNEGNLVNYYMPSVHACISGLMINNTYPPDKCIITIPASRANLLLYKIEKNPLLYEKIAAGWRIVKFRHIRHISSEHHDEPEQWQVQLDMDPLEFKPIQMKMF
jgi:hypothetical protein